MNPTPRTKHGLSALAGALVALAPTLPALWTQHEERDVCEAALEMTHEQLEIQAQSYKALVDRMSEYFLGQP